MEISFGNNNYEFQCPHCQVWLGIKDWGSEDNYQTTNEWEVSCPKCLKYFKLTRDIHFKYYTEK